MQTIAVVLAGGQGTRLWPASRADRPKQVLSFGGGPSLVEQTVARTEFADMTVVLTGAAVSEQVREAVDDVDVLVEPEPRDTGPALVYAAHQLRERVGECVMCCLPSDHVIRGEIAATMAEAEAVARETGSLVTIGVKPDRPATGYGYIEPGESVEVGDGRMVAAFHEKPSETEATSYVEDGWLWNAGMFVWTPEALLSAARKSKLAPLLEALEAGESERGFRAVDAVSIDNAVLESASNVAVVPAAFEWDDVGSWDAVGRVFGEALAPTSTRIDADGTVVASDEFHVSVLGVEDLVVAAYGEHVLVCPRERAEEVRRVWEAAGVRR